MAASDHLSQPQFYHATDHDFSPGETLTREGAWRAKHPGMVPELEASKRDLGGGETYYRPRGNSALNLFPTNNENHPVEDHLYYGDKGFVSSGESAGYGKHVYAVEHVTPSGRPAKANKPDPNYTREGMTGAYRTKNQLRVVGKVDQSGNLL